MYLLFKQHKKMPGIAHKHPLFDNKTSYFDVAILETEPVEPNEVSKIHLPNIANIYSIE